LLNVVHQLIFVLIAEIVEKVKVPNCGVFRPTLPGDLHQEVELTSLIQECWAEDASVRPTPARVIKTLNRINPNKWVKKLQQAVCLTT
jgi:hypothetical protein